MLCALENYDVGADLSQLFDLRLKQLIPLDRCAVLFLQLRDDMPKYDEH